MELALRLKSMGIIRLGCDDRDGKTHNLGRLTAMGEGMFRSDKIQRSPVRCIIHSLLGPIL